MTFKKRALIAAFALAVGMVGMSRCRADTDFDRRVDACVSDQLDGRHNITFGQRVDAERDCAIKEDSKPSPANGTGSSFHGSMTIQQPAAGTATPKAAGVSDPALEEIRQNCEKNGDYKASGNTGLQGMCAQNKALLKMMNP